MRPTVKSNFLAMVCLAILFNLSVPGVGWAQSLLADYTFNDTLASAAGTAANLHSIGNPAFQTEVVDGVNRRVLEFSAGDGCRLLNASQTLGDAYTIVVLFRFDSLTNPHFLALRSVPMALSGASRRKQIPSSSRIIRIIRRLISGLMRRLRRMRLLLSPLGYWRNPSIL